MEKQIIQNLKREFYELLGELSIAELAYNKRLHEAMKRMSSALSSPRLG